MACILLHLGADVDVVDVDHQNPLHLACWNGLEQVVSLLLAAEPCLENKNRQQRTPLSLACIQGAESVVKLLLYKGAAVNMEDEGCKTPLHLACEEGHEPVARLLVDAGAAVCVLTSSTVHLYT